MKRFKDIFIRLSESSGLMVILVLLFFGITITVFAYLFMMDVDYAFDGAYGAGATTEETKTDDDNVVDADYTDKN